MSENFVVLARPSSKNFIFPIKQVENKTVNQIIDGILQQNPVSFNKKEEILMITTPFYREAVESNCYPLKSFPDLILTEKPNIYHRPPNFLLICPKTEMKIKFFYLNAIVQDDIEIPPWEIGINTSSYANQPSTNLCKYLIDKFPYETDKSVSKSIVDENDKTPPASMKADQMLKEMIKKKYSIKCALSESELKKVKYRSQVVTEIQKSEEVYISQLTIIKDVIIPQFKKNRILLDEDYRKFDIISNMIQVHSQFLNDLKSAGTSFAANLSIIFLNFSDYFKIVKPYIKSLDSIYEMMSRVDKSKIDQIVKNEPRLNNVVPMSYFIVPFQRIPKYPLFLRDLINNTPKCHPDSNFLNLALSSIKTVLDNIEYSKESAEDQQKLYEIFMRTSKKVNLLDPRRRLLDQINGKLKSNGWKSIFYIFNDMVLLTAMKRNDEVVIHHSKIGDFCYLSQTAELTISFHLPDNNNTNCVVEFESGSDKDKFIELIEKNRLEQYKEIDQKSMFSISRICDSNLDGLAVYVYENESVALKNSKVIFSFGGNDPNNRSTNICSFFNITTKAYKTFTVTDGPSARSEHSLVLSDDSKNVYLFGGRSGSDFYNDLYVGTFKANNEIEWKKIVWENSEVEPEARSGHSMVYNKNELIVFGGFQKDKVFNDTLIYNIKDNKWNRLKSDVTILPSPRYYHSACKCGPWMVVHGGKCPQPLNDTFFFDMNEKKWLQFKITGETSYRYGHKSFFQNGYIVFIGGIDDKKEFVQPSVINTLKDKDWYYEDYKMIGNVPSTLFLFGQALFNSSQFFIYGGIDPITVENVSNSFYQIKLPSALMVNNSKIPVPQIIEATISNSPSRGELTRSTRKNTSGFFNFWKGKKGEKDKEESPENKDTTGNSKEINYDLLLGQIKVDPSKLLPFQKKQLEKYLNEYYSVLMDNNQILMSILDKFDKMRKNIKLPNCDIFVKLYDKLDSKIFIIKISSTTTFDQFLAILTEKMKNRSEYSVTIMKYYPFTPDFYDFNIYKVIKENLSHLNVFVQ